MIRFVKDFFSYFCVGFVTAFSPIKPIALTMVLLIFTDFIFGIYRSLRQKEEVTSRKMSKSLVKILLYNLIILLLYYINTNIFETGLPLEKAAATMICLVELKSIDETWKIIYGYSLWNRIVEILDRSENKSKKQPH